MLDRSLTVALAAILALGTAPGLAAAPESQDNLLGQPAPTWTVTDWLNSEPLTLSGLRGKVLLIRWWTGPTCPYCSASAPILDDLHRRYKDQGLVVVGFYHHKTDGPVKLASVRRWAKRMGMDFPLAVDHEWMTLRRYWLDAAPEDAWTSVSFLIDQKGIIRYVHLGGTITPKEGQRLGEEIRGLLNR